MKKSLLLIVSLFLISLLVSCASVDGPTKAERYAQLYSEEPVSILILPPVDRSLEIEMKDVIYSTLYTPLAEKGYYVYPPFLTLEILKQESAYDSEMFMDRDCGMFYSYFGADMVLFTTINECRKSLIAEEVVVDITYTLKSTKTNEILFEKRERATQDTNVNMDVDSLFSLMAKVALTAVNTAVVDYVPLIKQCNENAFRYLPYGKYHPNYLADLEDYPGSSFFFE